MVLRLLAIALVVANVAVFALNFEAGVYSDRERRRGGEPYPDVPALQLAPEEPARPEHTDPRDAAPAVPKTAAATAESGAAASPAPDAGQQTGAPPDTESAPRAGTCLRFGPLPDPADAKALKARFAASAKIRLDEVEEITRRRYWIYLEPAPPESVARTLDELERLGVEDFFRIRDGSFENAVSLGVFSTRAAVDRRLAEISDTGYQPVVVPRTERASRWLVEATVTDEDAFAEALEAPGTPEPAACEIGE